MPPPMPPAPRPPGAPAAVTTPAAPTPPPRPLPPGVQPAVQPAASVPPAPKPPIPTATGPAIQAPVAPPVAPPAPVQAPVAAPVAQAPAAPVAAPVVAPAAPVIPPQAPAAPPVLVAVPASVPRKPKETFGAKELAIPLLGGQDVLLLGKQLKEWLQPYLADFKHDGEKLSKGQFPDTAEGARAYALSGVFVRAAQTLVKTARVVRSKDESKLRDSVMTLIKAFTYPAWLANMGDSGQETIALLNFTDAEKTALGIPLG